MIRKDVTVINKIGKGANGICYLVESLCSKKHFVMKTISLNKITSKEKIKVLDEIKIMQKLNHPHIINFISYELTSDSVYIFMEYAENGTLFDVLKNNPTLNENQILCWAK
jgi:serine/threonine protein kinase